MVEKHVRLLINLVQNGIRYLPRENVSVVVFIDVVRNSCTDCAVCLRGGF